MSSYNVSDQNMVLNQPQPGGVTIASSGINIVNNKWNYKVYFNFSISIELIRFVYE